MRYLIYFLLASLSTLILVACDGKNKSNDKSHHTDNVSGSIEPKSPENSDKDSFSNQPSASDLDEVAYYYSEKLVEAVENSDYAAAEVINDLMEEYAESLNPKDKKLFTRQSEKYIQQMKEHRGVDF